MHFACKHPFVPYPLLHPPKSSHACLILLLYPQNITEECAAVLTPLEAYVYQLRSTDAVACLDRSFHDFVLEGIIIMLGNMHLVTMLFGLLLILLESRVPLCLTFWETLWEGFSMGVLV